MDKFLCVFGTGFLVAAIKMKEWLEGVVELIKGESGFFLILGVCGILLMGVSLILALSQSKIMDDLH